MEEFNIGSSFENAIEQTIEFLPLLFGALVILFVGYIISKITGGIIHRGLRKVRFDKSLHNSAAGNYIAKIVDSPSRFVGRVAFWLLFLLFVAMSVSVLQIPVLNEIVAGLYSYIPNIIAAVLIFLIASAISGGTGKFVQSVMGRTATARLINTVVPVIVLSIAGFMILNQLGVATDIVNILFTSIVGALALGMALAFGLGGRDIARDILQQAYDTAKKNNLRDNDRKSSQSKRSA